MVRSTVALIEETPHAEDATRRRLESAGFEVLVASEDALDQVLVSDARLFIFGSRRQNPERAITLLGLLARLRPADPVFILAWKSSEQLAVGAVKQHAADYFAPPIDLQEVGLAVRRSIGSRPAPAKREGQPENLPGTRAIVGESPSISELRSYLVKVAQRECNTLILGETGTGKDLIAEAIHFNSPRRNKPFISVNCAAIPDSLLESELFGYEKGAFTGANGATEGKISQANGGTLFFDEIGDMTPNSQAKILRVIESKQIQKLGGKASVPVNIRIVAATNQDLPKFISEQRFRKDLYFRLNVAQIQLPPLRERREDIVPLLYHYLAAFNRQTGSCVEGFTPQAVKRLKDYDWPGNVRELRSLVESIFIDPPYPNIDQHHLPFSGATHCDRAEGDNDRDRLLEALRITHWNKSKAAERLHWSRMKVYRKLAQYQIEERPDRMMATQMG